MQTQHKTFSRFVFSAAGIIAIGLILVAVNFIASMVNARLDMTEEKRYTLSRGTRAILKEMEAPVSVRFYYTRDVGEQPVWMKNYAPRVRDMLKEYKLIAGNDLIIEELNPVPDSDAEDSANLDGVYGQMLPTGEQIFFGLAFSSLDNTEVIPVLSPQDESMLEYEITRSIFQVLSSDKPTVGIMSSLPVLGQQPNMMMMQAGMGGRGAPPWYVFQELKKTFSVEEIAMDAESIAGGIDILVLIHPKNLSDSTLLAIDQFVLGGGKLLAFLDPMSYVEMIQQQSNPQMGGPPPAEPSNIAPLLKAWGIEYDPDKLLADIAYQVQVGENQYDPFILRLDEAAYNAEDPATAKLDNGLLVYPGAFSGTPVEGLQKTVLVQSSNQASLVESMMGQGMSRAKIVEAIKGSEKQNALAIRLAGTFATAFPNGISDTTAETSAAEEDPETAVSAAGPPALLSGESAVVLVADSDLLHNFACVQQVKFLGQNLLQQTSDNVSFVHNLVEHLSGDMNLLSVRSLGVKSRPLTYFQDLRAEAEKEYQGHIAKLEAELDQIRRELRELEKTKDPNQRFILTPEQEAKRQEARQKLAETARELKEVRKLFNKRINNTQTLLKVVNIGAVPFLVAVLGCVVALIKRRRMGRK